MKNLEILFDEHGTPTFKKERETDWFLGVAVTYDLNHQSEIFNKCDKLFGMSNKSGIKNDKISVTRATEIAKLVVQIPIHIFIGSINLSLPVLQEIIQLYEELGNVLREKHRQIRGRPINQILHSHILYECLFHSITNYVESNQSDSEFSIYIDDWCDRLCESVVEPPV
jgi:hypothetical protein